MHSCTPVLLLMVSGVAAEVNVESVEYFATNYGAARANFLEAANLSNAEVESLRHPEVGPTGEALFTDVALLGPSDAKTVLVLSSGTHGVEGFAGSAIQVGLLRERVLARLPSDVRILMIHGINPYGFAHLRRFNEDNVDLNRNFVDHSRSQGRNTGYEELSGALAPPVWSPWSNAVFLLRLQWHRLLGRTDWLRDAITGGQYGYPKGLFFGGRVEAWSNGMLQGIAERHLSRADRVVFVDVHTGLGDYGNAELIVNVPESDGGYMRAVAMWGEAKVRSTDSGASVSVDLDGTLKLAVPAMVPGCDVTAVSLEFGTVPASKALLALRAENWLHHHGGAEHPNAAKIKTELLRAFYPDSADWKSAVWQQGREVVELALSSLS